MAFDVVEEASSNFAKRLRAAKLPPDFFGSWEHCSSNRDSVLCHSIGLGLLAAAVADLKAVQQVGIDSRLTLRIRKGGRSERKSWRPDVVGFRRNGDQFIPVVYGDFESPNSSDGRVPVKDVEGYRSWLKAGGEPAPYVLVVCLPEREQGYWSLRYTKGWNKGHAGRLSELREKGPLGYWCDAWRPSLENKKNLKGITILNAGNGIVEPLPLTKRR